MSDEDRPAAEGQVPDDGASTDERSALEAERAHPRTDEYFDGIPPEQLAGSGDGVPELEPEFAEALREAGGVAARPEPAPPEPEPEAAPEPPAPEPEPEPQPTPEPQPSDPPSSAPDSGETIEYTAGESPEEVPQTESSEPASVAAAPASERAAPSEPAAPAEPPAASEPPLTPDPSGPVAHPAADPFIDQTRIMREGRDEARNAIATAAETGRPWAPNPPPPGGDSEPPPKRRRLWLRFLAASLITILAFASATTAVGVRNVNHFLKGITPIPGIEARLDAVPSGEPQTFLILGSDRRASLAAEGDRGLSDTTILLRIDPGANRIAVLNIPRDLKTYIPGVGTDKFNAAYAYGGPKLTLRTVKRLTAGTGLHINHLVNINFLGFAQAINAIDCVYIDVDRRYYHSNIGVPASEQYDEINIQPGYQRLCGADALDYVRFRHTDTDLVRASRQQEFLREARQRVPASELLKEVTGLNTKLIDIFASHTQSDIQDSSEALDILRLMIDARNAPIREVHFPATLGYSYVYASRSDIAGAIKQFLGFRASGGPRGSLEVGGPKRGPGGKGKNSKGKQKHKQKAPPTPTPQSDGLVDASSSGLAEAKKAARKASHGLPIYYPTRVPPGSEYDDNEELSSNPRVYHVNDTSGNVHEAYKTVLAQFADDGVHYFGVQGIRGWDNPPALDSPSESRAIGKLDCDIFLDGDRVRAISWHQGDNSYWVSNDLLQTLTNDQMLGMARSMRSITPNKKRHSKKKQEQR